MGQTEVQCGMSVNKRFATLELTMKQQEGPYSGDSRTVTGVLSLGTAPFRFLLNINGVLH